jgi:2-oxoacid:acceptor oxidoreductase gamma subunit (pyruvate/2-ketoisovalerate family)
MLEIRFHGRAGQGMVTAAELLAEAAAMEGKYSQAFPFFGSEKRGPPVTSYCRIDEKPITIHEEIEEPDIVIVAEPSVLDEVNVDAGLKPNGILIINSRQSSEEFDQTERHVFCINGTEIAVRHLGKPITNTVMLGALCKLTGIVKLESIQKALQNRFPKKIALPNIQAIEECYNAVSGIATEKILSHRKPQ